jgi:hypothetical protein
MLLAHADIYIQGLPSLEQFIWRSVQSFEHVMYLQLVTRTSFLVHSGSLLLLRLKIHHPHTRTVYKFHTRYT